MNLRYTSSVVAAASFLGLLVPSCGTHQGSGLMVVMRTDMTFPAYIASVGLYVSHIQAGRTETVLSTRLDTALQGDGTSKVALPADLAIESNGSSDSTVRVRVVAFDFTGAAVSMRESRSSVPTDRVAALPLPLLWMNKEDNLVDNQDPDPFVAYKSKLCPSDQLPDDNGDCAPIDVDVKTLETYVPLPPVVPTEPGTCTDDCFDVSTCFKPEFAEDVDDNYRAARGTIGWFDEGKGACGVPLGVRGQMARNVAGQRERLASNLAIAVRVAREEGAYCTKQDPNECYIVLDAKSQMTVADKETPDGPRYWAVLPTGVCRKWQQKKILGDRAVAVPGCLRKRANQPMCGDTQVGCSTDEGWDGQRNPRGNGGRSGSEADAGTGPIEPRVCRIPGASAIWADANHVVVMTETGAVTHLKPSLAGCEAAVTSGVLDGSTSEYRFSGVQVQNDSYTLGFMSGSGRAGTVSFTGDETAKVSPFGPLGSGAMGGFHDGTQMIYVGSEFTKRGDDELAGPDPSFAALPPFVRVTNGISFLGKERFFASAEQLGATTFGATVSSAKVPYALEAFSPSDAQPLHTAQLGTRLLILTRAKDGTPGLYTYAVAAAADAVGSIGAIGLSMTDGQAMPTAITPSTNLTGTPDALFLGDQEGRIIRITAANGTGFRDALLGSVAWLGSEPIHGLHYVPSGVRGPRISGFLFFVTWPGNDPAQARLQRIALDSEGNPTVPEPEPGSSSSSGGASSSSGAGGSSGASNTGSSSGVGSSSGRLPNEVTDASTKQL